MKRIILTAVTVGWGLVLPAPAQGGGMDINEGKWHIAVDADKHTLDIDYNGRRIISNGYAAATLMLGGNARRELKSTGAKEAEMTETGVDDCFGTGRRYTLTYRMDTGEALLQEISFYDALPCFIVRLGVKAAGGQAKSNRLAPLCTDTQTSFLPAGQDNRMLWIPWDNDAWIRFHSYKLDRSMTSFSVTALYNVASREGLVMGAVDHDTWKSAVYLKASANRQVDSLRCFSGYTSPDSRDSLEHGAVVADTVRSARFMVGCFDDWRQGMESFAATCGLVAAPRTWHSSAPYGWNSWGVLQTEVSYESVMDAMRFIRDGLMPRGFHDSEGKVCISLDSYWTNLTDPQVMQFVDSCRQWNMIPGLYATPFADWAKTDREVPGSNGKYRMSELWLRRNGIPAEIAGAYCLDPTHPGTKIAIMSNIARMKRLGVKYIKLDFMCDGAVEADSWYNKKVHTGIQAYNEGMAFIRKQTGEDIYLNLSIAPIFPYQYAEGRRISCDAYSSIENTQYVLNSTSYGWWTGGLYFANDPDNLVLKSIYHNGLESKGENRARVTSGAVTGAFINGDNYSKAVARGYPEESRKLAMELFTNEEVNEITRLCGRSFRPVEGGLGNEDGAENLFIGESPDYWYLAVVNYNKVFFRVSGKALFARLGIDAADVGAVRELWTGTTVGHDADGFSYDVPAKDARIYRIAKKHVPDAVKGTAAAGAGIRISSCGTVVHVESSSALTEVKVFNLQGMQLAGIPCNSSSCSFSLPPGLYVVRASAAGSAAALKVRL